MNNFTKLFNIIRKNINNFSDTVQDYLPDLEQYLVNAENFAWTNLSLSLMNVRLAIELTSDMIMACGGSFHPGYTTLCNFIRKDVNHQDINFRGGNDFEAFLSFIYDFGETIPRTRQNRTTGADNLARICFFVYNEARAKKNAKIMMFLYSYASSAVMHVNRGIAQINNLNEFSEKHQLDLNFQQRNYMDKLFYFFRNLFGNAFNIAYEKRMMPIAEPVEAWNRESEETFNAHDFDNFVRKSGVFSKIGFDGKRTYAYITMYTVKSRDMITAAGRITNNIKHFYEIYKNISTADSKLTLPRLGSTKIFSPKSEEQILEIAIVYQYFDSEPKPLNLFLSETEVSFISKLKISYSICHTVEHFHNNKVYIRALRDDTLVFVKRGEKEYIPVFTGIQEAKDYNANNTVRDEAKKYFTTKNDYCCPELTDENLIMENISQSAWAMVDTYAFAVLIIFLLTGKLFGRISADTDSFTDNFIDYIYTQNPFVTLPNNDNDYIEIMKAREEALEKLSLVLKEALANRINLYSNDNDNDNSMLTKMSTLLSELIDWEECLLNLLEENKND